MSLRGALVNSETPILEVWCDAIIVIGALRAFTLTTMVAFLSRARSDFDKFLIVNAGSRLFLGLAAVCLVWPAWRTVRWIHAKGRSSGAQR
jgi:hypothetical protein